jgi:hypothetical protein
VARVTSFVPPNFDLLLRPENGLVEFQVDVFAKIGSTLGPAASPAPAASENITEAKKVPKDIPEILEDGGVKARRAPTTSTYARVSEAVIERSLLAVRQNRVGFGDLFKLIFRVGVVRIAVRMVGHRQLAVGALDLDIGGRTCNPEDFVVVAFAVVGQKLSCASQLVSN